MPYGLQLFTVPHLLEVDFEGTLRRIAELGYEELEFFGPYPFSPEESRKMWRAMAEPAGLNASGYYERSPDEIASLLEDIGLTTPSAHYFLPTLRETLEPAMEAALRAGHETIVCSFLPAEDRTSIDDYRRLADRFNEMGERARKMGLRLGYHNHCFEFGRLDGDLPYRLLLEETEPELLTMELDVFWTASAGFDPIELLESYPDRISLCHLKDRADDRILDDPLHVFEDPEALRSALADLTNPGEGVLDFAAILEAGEAAGVEHFYLERDLPEDQARTITSGIRLLRSLG